MFLKIALSLIGCFGLLVGIATMGSTRYTSKKTVPYDPTAV